MRKTLGLLWLAAMLAPAQEPASREAGNPFIRWISPQEYEGSQQVWSFVQDDAGLVYVGISNGLRQYDGTAWRAIAMPHNAPVRGLARAANGQIFVGEVGDFGYLEPNAAGEMRFRSLLEFVPAGDRDFQDVRKVHPTPEGIYFQSLERLFLLTPDGAGWRAKVWKPATRFRNSFLVGGTLYVTLTGQGLGRLRGGEVEKLPVGGLEQSPETLVTALVPWNGNRILVGTGDGRLQVLDDQGLLQPLATPGSGLSKLGISGAGAVILADGALGIGTRAGGLLVLEADGSPRYHLDRAAGIPSDGVLALYRDREGTVWVGLQNGIARVELASPLSEFGRPAGMSAAVNAMARYRGLLHVATFAGLKYLDPATREFRMVAGLETPGVVGLLVRGDRLLATAGRDGLFEVKGDRAVSINKGAFSAAIAASRQDAARVWVGTRAGLLAIREEGGRWIDEGIIAATTEIRSIVEPEPGLLWLGTQARGVVRVRMRAEDWKKPEVKAFTFGDGLPGKGGVSVHLVAGRVVFTAPEGVREFDPSTGRFVASTALAGVPTGGSAEEFSVVTDPKGNVWANLGVRPVFLRRLENGGFQPDEGRLRRIGDGAVFAMSVEDDGVVWLGGLDRVLRYDPAQARVAGEPRPALIRRVTTGEAGKQVIFAGGGAAAAVAPELRYRDNEVRFEYALAALDDPQKNQFQSRLEGFDPDWSPWTAETRRDYTNLPEGKYVFRLRARDLAGNQGAEAAYPLTILPPWYRSWWAYLLYALALAGLLAVADRVLRARVLAREREASMLREAQLRAETAAAEAKTLQAENERNKNVQLLSEIGKELTSSLDLDTIFFRLYEHVNQLTDAPVFGVALYHEQRHELEYRLAVENGKRYPPFSRDTRQPNQLPVWCVAHRQPVVLGDVEAEHRKYIESYEETPRLLEDGSASAPVASIVYLPLLMKDRVLGVITAQSYRKNAYTDYHVDVLENLASYTAIALDNADTYLRLKTVQDQLVVQEKLASLGALTAGIAHEIKNPLNFVNNFAEMSVELMDELREEVEKIKDGGAPDVENMEDLLEDLSSNARKINEHGKRADGIVKSMLLHSRGGAGERQMIDINAMIDENVNLAYHGLRAQDSSFNVTIERAFAPDAGKLDGIPQDLSRVFLNVLNNACYAVNEKLKKVGQSYSPVLRVATLNLGDSVEVRLRDNGPGIPPEVRAKIFNPFFTTKPTGVGTGLGLSISHDIVVQEHGGELEVDTAPGEFTEFIVRLPRFWKKGA